MGQFTFSGLLPQETRTAISNIENTLKDEAKLSQLANSLRHNDISFVRKILGSSRRGNNGSCYRAFLAMDEQNIIVIRFSNHCETKETAYEKFNNRPQFSFQVVSITLQSAVSFNNITEQAVEVGNPKILTNVTLCNSPFIEGDMKNMLMSLHDYLIHPPQTFEQIIDYDRL